jgi:putative phosphoribosyl transferase
VLAKRLKDYAGQADVLVLALPRGGVPVAYEVASALSAPLDVFLVRKLGLPGQPELAMGAIATGGVQVWNTRLVEALKVPESVIERVAAAEGEELARREMLYRDERPPPEIRGRRVILIDDGLATGTSMQAAVVALRRHEPVRVVVGVPIAAPESCDAFRSEVDEIICAVTPEPFLAVGYWYDDFSPTSDAEVRELLEGAVRTIAQNR